MKYLIALLFFVSAAYAENSFYVGNSLVSNHMPPILNEHAQFMGKNLGSDTQIGPGRSLSFSWNVCDPTHKHYKNHENCFLKHSQNRYHHMTIVESVPLNNKIVSGTTQDYLMRFYNEHKKNSSGDNFYLLEGWNEHNQTNVNAWINSIDNDLAEYEKVIVDVEAMGANVELVPVGQAWKELHNRIDEVPGFDHVFQFFKDGIHPTDQEGRFFQAMLFYSVIFGESPYSETNPHAIKYNLTNWQAQWLQRIAWDAYSKYNGSDPGPEPEPEPEPCVSSIDYYYHSWQIVNHNGDIMPEVYWIESEAINAFTDHLMDQKSNEYSYLSSRVYRGKCE